MEKFIDKIGAKYVVQKIKETIRVVQSNEIDEVQVSQMFCLPDTDYQDEYLTLSAMEDGEGTFVKNSAATWNVTGVNGIPSGWTITTASA